MRKPIIIVVTIVIILLVSVVGALFWASKNAAVIANEIAIEQKVLKGKITVHKLEIGIFGNINFENFVWLDPEGKLVADIPRGTIKINLQDAITGNFNSKSLEKIEFDSAAIHLVFNDNMELNVLNLVRDKQDANKKDATPKEKQEFNLALVLKNSKLSTTYTNRHFAMESVNADIKLDTGNALMLNIKTNKISGNIASDNVELSGKIDLKPQTPVYDLNFNVGSIIPSSISSGIEIDQPLAIKSKISGELPNPVIIGDFAMSSLSMSPLALDNIKGKFRYKNAVLNITESTANTYGGSVQATGTVNIDSKSFSFDLTGQGLSSTQVADDKLYGSLNFTMLAQGSAARQSLSANGHFYIGEGKFSGIPFKSMEGDFSRYSGKMSFKNIVIRTIAGEFTTNMLQNSLGEIQLGNMTPFFIENAIKDELTKKGRDFVKGLFR